MYGIINKAIEELVIANFGEAKWDAIKIRSGIDVDYFLSREPYDDEITYALAQAVADEMGITINSVLILFGEWWIVKTTTKKYAGLMHAGGNNFRDFLINLPLFHNRIMLLYPKLTPPEFEVSNSTANSIHLHYRSKRAGLQDFVRGLIQGLGVLYETKVDIDLLQSRDKGSSHEIFKITW